MSVDEVRTQKALALLERTEAEKDMEDMKRTLTRLGNQLQASGSSLLENRAHLVDPDQLVELASTVKQALERFKTVSQRLSDSAAKCKEFGL